VQENFPNGEPLPHPSNGHAAAPERGTAPMIHAPI
jgi:hypothetical protein